VLVPSQPITSTRDHPNSNMNTIAFTWQVANEGGTPVIDHEIYYD
jgi:hypothetical protein